METKRNRRNAKDKAAARKDRLAAALRANLKKRKRGKGATGERRHPVGGQAND